jgi:hypothetical protein
LASCNEHVVEAIFLRPHPPTPRVLCTVPTQSSKLERSEKQLNFLVRETCAHYLHFLVPGPRAACPIRFESMASEQRKKNR